MDKPLCRPGLVATDLGHMSHVRREVRRQGRWRDRGTKTGKSGVSCLPGSRGWSARRGPHARRAWNLEGSGPSAMQANSRPGGTEALEPALRFRA
jgi:hypothetical protein